MPKKAFVVYPRTKEVAKEGLRTKGGKKRFRGGSFINVSENGAAEIRDTYGNDKVHVVEDEQLGRALNGEKWEVNGDKVKTLHRYFFGAMPLQAEEWIKRPKRTHEWVIDDMGEWELVELPDHKQKRKARRVRGGKSETHKQEAQLSS